MTVSPTRAATPPSTFAFAAPARPVRAGPDQLATLADRDHDDAPMPTDLNLYTARGFCHG